MKAGQIKFLLIVFIFALPFFISYMIMDDYTLDKKWNKTNYGELIEPVISITNIPITNVNNDLKNTSLLNGKWILIYQPHNTCMEQCLNEIYLLRQVHTALGKDADRLTRLLLSNKNTDNNLLTQVKKSYPNFIIVNKKPDALHGLIKKISSSSPLFLVDPLGNVILKYEDNFEGKKLLKDIKKLFRLSRVG